MSLLPDSWKPYLSSVFSSCLSDIFQLNLRCIADGAFERDTPCGYVRAHLMVPRVRVIVCVRLYVDVYVPMYAHVVLHFIIYPVLINEHVIDLFPQFLQI